jgi:hypothetical protein
MFFIIISALHVSGGFSASGRQQESMTIPKAAHVFYKLLMMRGKPARKHVER